ncbi:bifunctional DNA primase/polymerase [Bradyrhizobium iriomotense]|uniref:DNA primase n=1 Tax=Bradyrhizobium iriomotense TaxID=441950 RepID=A0ABQ6B169_9BRAD|nr:bifunctional DNA primase/polymerase [Bradyrhizobium iriomotense]GLR85847.1 DNA primase [Bradyrhizobium iriomotense]
MSPLAAALQLAAADIPCFPVARSKCPTTPHGFRDASTDPDALSDLWGRYGGPLVGIRTGASSGLDVLDLDQKPAARAWWTEHRERIPTTRVHRSRSGGLHLVFRHAPSLRCSTSRIAIGVDVKADDGCIIWWPAAGLPVLCDAPLAPWPDWLEALAQPAAPPSSRPVAVVADGKLIRGILGVVARANEGERNRSLYWAACRLAESTLGRTEADALLINVALQIGLPVTEARATIASAYLSRTRGG